MFNMLEIWFWLRKGFRVLTLWMVTTCNTRLSTQDFGADNCSIIDALTMGVDIRELAAFIIKQVHH